MSAPKKTDAAQTREYRVKCQDGIEARLLLTKTGEGDFPPPARFQVWFNKHGDPMERKVALEGCAVCRFAPVTAH